MLIWNFNGQGPNSPPGQIYVATLGSAVAFSAGLAIGYTGLVLANPATARGSVPVKIIPLRAGLMPTTLGGVNAANPWGLIKWAGQGTASNGGVSAFSGAIYSPGVAGTTTGVAIVGGTFSLINGTAGPAATNTLMWQEMLGCLGVGTATNYPVSAGPSDLQGLESVMPGETIAIGADIAVTGRAMLAWLEVPLNSGS